MKVFGKASLFIILILLTIKIFTVETYYWTLLDNINLGVHEFGHLLFGIFGSQVLTVWGGTLLQLAVPAIFLVYFLLRKDYFAVYFALFWLGHNFLNVSYYLGDAQCRCIPLLGGDGSIHDWHFLLSRYGKLKQTTVIATGVAFFGKLVLISSLLFIGWDLIKEVLKRYEIRIRI